MIRRVFRALFSGVGIVLMVTIVLSLCLWFLGSYFGFGDTRPFETLVGTLVGLAVLWIGALMVILLILLTAKTRDASSSTTSRRGRSRCVRRACRRACGGS